MCLEASRDPLSGEAIAGYAAMLRRVNSMKRICCKYVLMDVAMLILLWFGAKKSNHQ
jgi:hypothetical protein